MAFTEKELDATYEVVRQVGTGGQAIVLEVVNRFTHHHLAAKLLRSVDEDSRKRLIREGTALMRLNHPNVVKVVDLRDSKHGLYLLMDLVQGDNLEELLEATSRKGNFLTPTTVAEWMVQVCQALEYVHECGMLHRDIKPSNILLTAEGIRLIDFGILHEFHGPKITRTGLISGTAAFLAPEVLVSGETTVASEVYAAGATLYNLLSGMVPVIGGMDLRAVFADADPTLADIVARATAVNPEQRQSSAAVLAEELSAWLQSMHPRVSEKKGETSTVDREHPPRHHGGLLWAAASVGVAAVVLPAILVLTPTNGPSLGRGEQAPATPSPLNGISWDDVGQSVQALPSGSGSAIVVLINRQQGLEAWVLENGQRRKLGPVANDTVALSIPDQGGTLLMGERAFFVDATNQALIPLGGQIVGDPLFGEGGSAAFTVAGQLLTTQPGGLPVVVLPQAERMVKAAWAPGGDTLAIVQQEGGKQTLHLWSVDDGDLPLGRPIEAAWIGLTWGWDNTLGLKLVGSDTNGDAKADILDRGIFSILTLSRGGGNEQAIVLTGDAYLAIPVRSTKGWAIAGFPTAPLPGRYPPVPLSFWTSMGEQLDLLLPELAHLETVASASGTFAFQVYSDGRSYPCRVDFSADDAQVRCLQDADGCTVAASHSQLSADGRCYAFSRDLDGTRMGLDERGLPIAQELEIVRWCIGEEPTAAVVTDPGRIAWTTTLAGEPVLLLQAGDSLSRLDSGGIREIWSEVAEFEVVAPSLVRWSGVDSTGWFWIGTSTESGWTAPRGTEMQLAESITTDHQRLLWGSQGDATLLAVITPEATRTMTAPRDIQWAGIRDGAIEVVDPHGFRRLEPPR